MRNLFCMIAVLLVLPVTAAAGPSLPGPYRAEIIEVIDGDTFRARIQVWLGQTVETLVRIEGIDAPELRGKCEAEEVLARAARARLAALAGAMVEIYDIRADKYGGRVIASVRTGAGRDVGAALRAQGDVRAYAAGSGRAGWCGRTDRVAADQ